jgi:pimeloyl-ACP methyl ester carboxylesterase
LLRIDSLDLPWDVGGLVYDPAGPIATGPDGKQIGVLLIHGGGGDHRSFDVMARLLAGKGYRVVTVTYPGNLYLGNKEHDWPGDTMEGNGKARTPIWAQDEEIDQDQYDLVERQGDDIFRAKYGTLFFAHAKPGTRFYDRLAAQPMAYEEAYQAVCLKFLGPDTFSIYCSGVSTGGHQAHLLLQRVPNIVGLVGAESSPFGSIFGKMLNQGWPYNFDMMTVRTWRDVARYAGPEAGPEGARRLPWLMEEVFEKHRGMLHKPLMKAQQIVQFGAVDALRNAATAVAARLKLGDKASEELRDRFAAYPSPLPSSKRPVPPLLYCIMANSRDHSFERYNGILLPELAKLDTPPKARIVRFDEGIHTYQVVLPGLPYGTAPAVADMWEQAIMGGYYLPA